MQALKISLGLNLALIAAIVFVGLDRRANQTAPVVGPVPVSAAPTTAPPPLEPPPMLETRTEPEPFRWQQLESRTDYRKYIANLRAAGCPESTIEDIVRGDTDRAFAWERQQLALDGSGEGPWSEYRETQLAASLLGEPMMTSSTVASSGETQNAETASGSAGDQLTADQYAKSYPLFLQNVNWSALGFSADDQAAIAQVRQQFQKELNVLNQNAGNPTGQNFTPTSQTSGSANANSGNPTSSSPWQTALQDADQQLSDSLGSQEYAAYEQQQYYAWFQPQAQANVGGGVLNINPGAFALK